MKEAAQRLGISTSAVYQAIGTDIKATKKFGKVVVSEADVDKYKPRAYQGKRAKDVQE